MRSTEVCEANLGRGFARAEPVNRCYVPRTKRGGMRAQRGSERSGESPS